MNTRDFWTLICADTAEEVDGTSADTATHARNVESGVLVRVSTRYATFHGCAVTESLALVPGGSVANLLGSD